MKIWHFHAFTAFSRWVCSIQNWEIIVISLSNFEWFFWLFEKILSILEYPDWIFNSAGLFQWFWSSKHSNKIILINQNKYFEFIWKTKNNLIENLYHPQNKIFAVSENIFNYQKNFIILRNIKYSEIIIKKTFF